MNIDASTRSIMDMNAQEIDLLRGWPDLSLLPVDLIRDAANAALSRPDVAYDGLCYGPDPGYEPAREAIAAWLTSFFEPQKPISSSRICITGGASQSMACMLSVYTDPEYTRNIWIVSPSYMLAFRTFSDQGFGLKMRAVPEDEQGLDLDYLRAEITKSEERAREEGNDVPKYKIARRGAKIYKHVIYCVPTFANPSSRTMSLERRQGLVRLAREFDALIIPDDVYDFLCWSAKTDAVAPPDKADVPRLVDIDRELEGGAERPAADGFGNACSNGSFSKLAGPGMRVGWVEGTELFAYGISQAGEQASGGAPSQLTSTYLTELLNRGQLQQHITHVLRPAYASRYHQFMHVINAELVPLGCTLPQPTRDTVGGYFVWLMLPDGISAQHLAEKCQEKHKLRVAMGSLFEVPDQISPLRCSDHLRLCFAWEDEAKLVTGIKRLAVALQDDLASLQGQGT